MIGVDTNVLVRYLAQDDLIQSAKAMEFFERRLSPDTPGYISTVVIIETSWVLRRHYHWSGLELASILEKLLQADSLSVENEEQVSQAVKVLERGEGDFADALIGAAARGAGCSHVVSFDRKALRLPGFVPV
jgi:predicted nucleic-acid-binding protein